MNGILAIAFLVFLLLAMILGLLAVGTLIGLIWSLAS